MTRVPAALAGSLLMTTLAACGPDDRPAAARETAEEVAMATSLLPAPERAPPVRVCVPGTERACIVTYIEGDRKNCFPAQQFCRADGFGWLACNEPAEAPLPPEPEREGEEDAEPEYEEPPAVR